jgi:DeoR/GlpR family transcriptional regulator of sugar metabolism
MTTNTNDSIRKNWIDTKQLEASAEKQVMARHVATHDFIHHGSSLLIGAGTSNISLIDEVLQHQLGDDKGLDLSIITNSLQVFYRIRDAKQIHAKLLADTEVSLTGGVVRRTLDSMIGRAAAKAVKSPHFSPELVFFGAHGVTFKEGLSLSYHFEDELEVQEALATRPTHRRFLLADHTKFSKRTSYQAELCIEDLLRSAHECYVITTVDENSKSILLDEAKALQELLRPIAGNPVFDGRDFMFRVIDKEGNVWKQVSLGDLRRPNRSSAAA